MHPLRHLSRSPAGPMLRGLAAAVWPARAPRPGWRAPVLAWALALGLAGCATGPATHYVGAWSAAPQDRSEPSVLPGRAPLPGQTLEGQTLRQVVRLSTTGSGLRVKLSNRFGQGPVTFDAARVALATSASSIDPRTDRPVTWQGDARVTLAAGAEMWSDAVPLPVAAHSLLAVSLVVAGPVPLGTQHTLARQTAFVERGAVPSATTFAYPETLRSYHWLAGVDVVTQAAPRVVVAFGDSLTDGYASTADQSRRYPDLLDNRFKAAGQQVSVVNAGISGNRWRRDVVGPSGESRFVRDVLEVSGVTHAVILLGINDIGFSVFQPTQDTSADEVIAALQAAVGKARARGVHVLLGTLLPFEGARYFTPAGEAKRQAVNAWIRAHREVHGVIDFDAAVRDPARPATLFPAYDSGDHLHPNDDGYAAMANAVDLALFK